MIKKTATILEIDADRAFALLIQSNWNLELVLERGDEDNLPTENPMPNTVKNVLCPTCYEEYPPQGMR